MRVFNYFCVDEAHLLIDWGDAFRPDFHSLTAVRNGLLHSCKDKQFKTLLFSATFTSAALELIESSQIDVKQLITHTYSITDTQKAFDHARSGDNAMKIIITK